jgi:nucleoside-diphosphate-sugar epimerase
MTAAERVSRMLTWFGLDRRRWTNLAVVQGDLSQADLGLDDRRRAWLAEETDAVVHCASDTSFSERHRRRIEKANVTAVAHLLDFAVDAGCREWHHLSTAYVAGPDDGPCPEDFVAPRRFTNVYEETKHRAEELVRAAAARAGMRLDVYRPSVVYGGTETGRTFRFNALYHPMRVVHFLRDLYVRDIADKGGRRAAALGIRRDPRGRVRLPLRIPAGDGGGINLVPVDHFTRAFLTLMERPNGGGIHHIVNPRQTSVARLVAYGRRFFGLTGVRPAAGPAYPANGLEAAFERSMRLYLPYMTDSRCFACDGTRRVLAARGVICPRFDYPLFARCMRYAVDHDWAAPDW